MNYMLLVKTVRKCKQVDKKIEKLARKIEKAFLKKYNGDIDFKENLSIPCKKEDEMFFQDIKEMLLKSDILITDIYLVCHPTEFRDGYTWDEFFTMNFKAELTNDAKDEIEVRTNIDVKKLRRVLK